MLGPVPYVAARMLTFDLRQVMEFVKGRIITDPDLGDLSPEDRRKA